MNSPSWILQTQSLRNEVTYLQKILDEINESSKLVQQQIQAKAQTYLQSDCQILKQDNLPQIKEEEDTQNQDQSQQSNKNKETVQTIFKQLTNLKRGKSNLKQPTKIMRSNGKQSASDLSNENYVQQSSYQQSKQKSLAKSRQQRLQNQSGSQKKIHQETVQNANHSLLEESLDTSIKNRYFNIIKNLDDEINSDIVSSKLKLRQQVDPSIYEEEEIEIKQVTPEKDKNKIEEELDKLRQTLEFIKEQELVLITRISEDKIPENSQKQQISHKPSISQQSFDQSENQTINKLINQIQLNDSSLLVIECDDQTSNASMISGNQKIRQHHRRISRQSFGCRSLQELKGSLFNQPDQTSQQQSIQQSQNNHIFNLDLSGFAQNNQVSNHNMPLQIQGDLIISDLQHITTPRTVAQNLEETIQSQGQQPIQTPFFSRNNLHAKKQSQTQDNLLDPILQKLSDNIEIQLRRGSELPKQYEEKRLMDDYDNDVDIQYHRKEHAFHTSRSNSRIVTDEQTPREQAIHNMYITQRSTSRGSNNNSNNTNTNNKQQRTRNNFDYSKMSKHMSIAKMFESRRISKIQASTEKTPLKNEFELKRTSTSTSNLTDRQSLSSRNESGLTRSNSRFLHQTQKITNIAQIALDKRKPSVSKDKYTRNSNQQIYHQTQNIITKQSLLKSRQSEYRMNLKIEENNYHSSPEHKQNNNNNIMSSLLMRSSNGMTSSRNGQSTNRIMSSTINSNASDKHQLNKDKSLVQMRKIEIEQERQHKLKQKIQQKECRIMQIAEKKHDEEKHRKEPLTIYEKTMQRRQKVEDRRKNNNYQVQNAQSPRIENNPSSKTPTRQQRKTVVFKLGAQEISQSPFRSNNNNNKQIINQADNSRNQRYSLMNSSGQLSNQSNLTGSTTSLHSRQHCNTCQKLSRQGLSSNFCPMHSGGNSKLMINASKHSQQAI